MTQRSQIAERMPHQGMREILFCPHCKCPFGTFRVLHAHCVEFHKRWLSTGFGNTNRVESPVHRVNTEPAHRAHFYG